MGVDLLAMWNQMGTFVKVVVMIMGVMSIWSLSIVVAKFIEFRRSIAATRKFAPEFSRAIQEEQLDQAIAVAEKHKKSHVARVLGEALGEVKPLLQDRATVTAGDINSAERAVERQMLLELSKLRRGLALLATVGATAPFVGLLGTTMGIVNSFHAMSTAGASSGLAGISAGISEALIATAFGLMVAIPAVWAYNYFTNKLDFMTAEMTFISKELIDYLIKSVGSEFGRSIFTKEFQAQKAVTGSGHIHG